MAPEADRTHHVLLLDGTSQDLTSYLKSHIAFFANTLVKDVIQDGIRQKVYYEPGIGTGRGSLEKLDAAVAFSFERYISEKLKFLKSRYQEGDDITIIGYSRGAAAAMVIARFIKLLGIPDQHSRKGVILKAVRSLIRKNGQNCNEFQEQKRRSSSPNALVTRLILLDPVASTLRVRHNNVTFETGDAGQVICCYSVDESRLVFPQVEFSGRHDPTHTELAVFRGCHCDIGGASGSPIRFIPLRYAITKAHTMGPRLVFKPYNLQALGLDPAQLGMPRDPPLVEYAVNYAVFVAQVPAREGFLKVDKDHSESLITKSRHIVWKLVPFKHRRCFEPPVKVHWTVHHHENFRNHRIKAMLPNPCEYTA